MLKARIFDRWTYLDWGNDLDLMEAVCSIFRFHPDGYEFMPTFVDKQWDGWISLINGNKVATGLYEHCLPRLLHIAKVEPDDRRTELPYKPLPARLLEKARPYQLACFNDLRVAKTGGLVLNATGSGKTLIAGMYFQSLQGTGIFVVDELTLLRQSCAALADILQDPVGVMGGGDFKPQRISVATIQTLHKRLAKIPKPDVVFIDEVHEALNPRMFQTIRALNPPLVFGLTATLRVRKRSVMMQAARLCGPVIFKYPIERGIKEQYLSQGIVVRIPFGERWQHISSGIWGSVNERYDAFIVRNDARNRLVADLADTAAQEGHATIVLVTRIEHLQKISDALKTEHVVLSGDTPADQRFEAIQRMKQGNLKVIVTNRIFSKGIDIPNLEVVIDATAGSSRNQVQQRFGRGVRVAQGKQGLIHFDIADRFMHSGTEKRLAAYRELKVPVLRWKGGLDADAIVSKAKSFLYNNAACHKSC